MLADIISWENICYKLTSWLSLNSPTMGSTVSCFPSPLSVRKRSTPLTSPNPMAYFPGVIGIALDSEVKESRIEIWWVSGLTKLFLWALYMRIVFVLLCHSWTLSLLDTRVRCAFLPLTLAMQPVIILTTIAAIKQKQHHWGVGCQWHWVMFFPK